MIFIRRRGQLSLEFILLILGLMIAGTAVTMGLVEKSPISLGNEVSEIKKESMGVFATEAKFGSNTGTVVENNSHLTNKTNTTDNSSDNTTDNSTNEQDLPDLVPESLIIVYSNNNSKIAHCYRERYQNHGYEQQLEKMFRHHGGCCNNYSNVKIFVYISNIGKGAVNKTFIVALFDNNELVATTVPRQIGDNEWQAVFDYTISTSKGHKHNHGAYKGCKCVYEHIIKAVVNPEGPGRIPESNYSNNEISVEINITKRHGHHGHGNNNNCQGTNKTKSIITQYNVSGIGINVNPTNSQINNELTIYNTNGHIYYLYRKGNNQNKGLFDINDSRVIPIQSGKSYSGNATKIIFRWKRTSLYISVNGIDISNYIGFNKKVTVVANNPTQPIKYSITHENGAGNFYLSFSATNATIYLEDNKNNKKILVIKNGKIEIQPIQ